MKQKLLFLDTFILTDAGEDKEFANQLIEYILRDNWTLTLNTMSLIEVYGRQQCLEGFLEFLVKVPFVIVGDFLKILEAEVLAYPAAAALPIGYCSSSCPNKEILKQAIHINLVDKIAPYSESYRARQKGCHEAMLLRRDSFMRDLRTKPGKFNKWLFLQSDILETLYKEHRDFVLKFKKRSEYIQIELFKSALIQSLSIYVEYYIQRKNGKRSDVGDFFHLPLIPYVSMAVLDKEKVNLIDKIRKTEKINDLAHCLTYDEFRTQLVAETVFQ